MANGDPPLRLNGQNVLVTVFVGQTPYQQSEIAKSISIEPRVTEHNDAFLGSDADDPDNQVRGWTAKIEMFMADSVLAKALLQREADRVARRQMQDLSVGLVFENRDGTQDGFILQRCEMKPLPINATGAAERIMNSLEVRAKRYVPSAL